jgi:hypothetical protein
MVVAMSFNNCLLALISLRNSIIFGAIVVFFSIVTTSISALTPSGEWLGSFIFFIKSASCLKEYWNADFPFV